jgi:CRP-like cAMP-binding protein
MSKSIDQSVCRNGLLGRLDTAAFSSLAHDLQLTNLDKGTVLVAEDAVVNYLYFIEDGIGSIITTSPEGLECEAGLFGFDGVGPISPIFGVENSPNRVIIQVIGQGYRIERIAFMEAVDNSKSLKALLFRYAHTLMAQTCFTALSNAVHSVDERLARWLLMCHDRSLNDDIALTHDFMSLMLAVRRPSVTTSLHALEGNGFIRTQRGYVTIRNRAGLEDFASDTYGKAEDEYRRSIGLMRKVK